MAIDSASLPIVEYIFPMTRDEFEIAARPCLARPTVLTARVLTRARVLPEEIGGVFFVGGSSRMPLASKTTPGSTYLCKITY